MPEPLPGPGPDGPGRGSCLGLPRRQASGALTGWCSRLEGEPGDVFLPADVRSDDLVEVVEDLLTL
jgi:hypothetical protein